MSTANPPLTAAAAAEDRSMSTPRPLSVLIFGSSGMIGQAVLRQALLHPRISRIVTVNRSLSPLTHPKLSHLTTTNLSTLHLHHQPPLSNHDAAFWCIGVSSAGQTESDYTAITYTLTLDTARSLLPLNPGLKFIFVSAHGADPSLVSSTMWARVKGRTETDVLALFPQSGYVVRPAVVVPMNGIESRTGMYRWGYRVLAPALWLMRKVAPESGTDTTEMGEAMLRLVEKGYGKRVLETADIRQLGRDAAAEAAATAQSAHATTTHTAPP